MPINSESSFKFSPRPEAHAMAWQELQPPVRRAVRDLLLRINGATQRKLRAGEVAANCFLVYGDRGTGKTTVLLSAKDACDPTKNFFVEKEDQEERIFAEAKTSGKELGNVVWLDVLDVEPLPQGANLLTTMLTRVREALYPSDSENQSFETSTILGESGDTGRASLNQLINDATLMWEDIHEQDTRSRANRQVAAADIYAGFQKRFRDTLDTLSRELGRRRSGSGDEYRPIVLPIDNIDRSTEHLHSIVKLAQMVFSPRLWLVLAGDREDVDTFLERAYWKELIRVGESAGATGKAGSGGEDEALVMARRQAAAASHRLLPPSHRIKVDLMKPEETLKFAPTEGRGLPGYEKTISELLKGIDVTEKECVLRVMVASDDNPEDEIIRKFEEEFEAKKEECAVLIVRAPNDSEKWTVAGFSDEGEFRKVEIADSNHELCEELKKEPANQSRIVELATSRLGRTLEKEAPETFETSRPHITLLELFNAEDRLREVVGEIDKTGTVRKSDTGYLTEAAELGLRLPTRAVLDLWQLAYWVTNDKEIPKNHMAEKIAKTMLRNLIAESSMSSEMSRCLQERIIRRNPQGGTMLDFWDEGSPKPLLNVYRLSAADFDLKLPAVQSELEIIQFKTMMLMLQCPQERFGKESGVLLPDLVAAWLTILYDALIWGAKDSTVINPCNISPSIAIECSTPAASALEWRVPQWPNFIAHDICGQLWRHFLFNLRRENLLDLAGREGSLSRLLATGWVACVLGTFAVFAPPGDWKSAKDIFASLNSRKLRAARQKSGSMAEAIKDAEVAAMKAAADVYEKIFESRGPIYYFDEAARPMRDWLERVLPLLLGRLFVPMADGDKTRAEEITELLEGKELAKFWKKNSADILGKITSFLLEEYKKLEPPSELFEEYRKELRKCMNDMYDAWPDSTSSDD